MGLKRQMQRYIAIWSQVRDRIMWRQTVEFEYVQQEEVMISRGWGGATRKLHSEYANSDDQNSNTIPYA